MSVFMYASMDGWMAKYMRDWVGSQYGDGCRRMDGRTISIIKQHIERERKMKKKEGVVCGCNL
jgi:hypothetical protein